MPEELVKPEELSKYRQVASHVVSGRRSAPLLSWAGAGQHGEQWVESCPWPPAPFLPLAADLLGLLCLPVSCFPSKAFPGWFCIQAESRV